MQDAHPNVYPVHNAPLVNQPTPVCGILSIIFSSASMFPLLGVVSVAGLILGIVALCRHQKTTGIIGTSIACLGIATSPILWALVISLEALIADGMHAHYCSWSV